MGLRGGLTSWQADPSLLVSLAPKDDAATPGQIYRDLAQDGRLDGRYTRVEIQRAFDVPPATNMPLPRVAIQAAPRSQPEASTPMTALPEFWISLFLVAMLVWWCVDHIVIAKRRKR
jgi:hypothetical protein